MAVGRDVPREARASASPVDAAVRIDILDSAGPGEQRARPTAPRSSRYAIGSSSEPEGSGTVEHVGWNRTTISVVVRWIVAPAIGFRHADNADLVGAISRCGQTRHRARSTRDRT